MSTDLTTPNTNATTDSSGISGPAMDADPPANGAAPRNAKFADDAFPMPEGYIERLQTQAFTLNDRAWQALHILDEPSKAETTLIERANLLDKLAKDARKKAENLQIARGISAVSTTAPPNAKRGFLSELHADPPEPPLCGVIADNGATLIYGWGGVGKGSYIVFKILELLRAYPDIRILLIDAENRLYEWKPRFLFLGATEDELSRILYYQPDSSPLWEQGESLQRFLNEHNFTPDLIVVDSIERAAVIDLSGGNNEYPIKFYTFLDTFAPRHVSLGHVSENASLRKPFGSKRWHDDARLTWSLEARGEQRILINRKNNNGSTLSPRAVRITAWSQTAVPFPTKVEETGYREAVVEILQRMIEEPMTYDELTDLINEGIEDADQMHTKNAVKLAITGNKHIFAKVGGTSKKPLFDLINKAPKQDPQPDLWTCYDCKQPLPKDDSTIRDGQFRIHKNGCPAADTVDTQ